MQPPVPGTGWGRIDLDSSTAPSTAPGTEKVSTHFSSLFILNHETFLQREYLWYLPPMFNVPPFCSPVLPPPAATMVELGKDKRNPDELAEALDERLGDFAFPDEFVFDVWGAIGDAKVGRY